MHEKTFFTVISSYHELASAATRMRGDCSANGLHLGQIKASRRQDGMIELTAHGYKNSHKYLAR